MKICIFWENYGPYHFARLLALRAWCAAHGHEAIGLEISENSSTYAWRRQDGKHEGLTTLFPGRIAESISAVKTYRKAMEFFKYSGCQVVFTPSYWPLYSVLAALAARSLGISVVMMNESHRATGNNSGAALAVKRQIARLYGAALVGGGVHRQFHRELGFRDELIFEGYDVVDNDYFACGAGVARARPEETRARFKLPERYILNVGRFVEKKNLATLIRAYALARQSGQLNGCDLVLVGSGPVKGDLIRLIRNLGLPMADMESLATEGFVLASEMVRFYPFAGVGDLPQYYSMADCFVLPSHREEWGLVVNEAMASSCPVIVSRSAGCAGDLVVAGETGYTFAPDSAEHLAAHLQEIGTRPAKAHEMGQRASEHIQNWSCERFARSALLAAEAVRNSNSNRAASP